MGDDGHQRDSVGRGGGKEEGEDLIEMYWLGAQCPRCGRGPKLMVGKEMLEIMKQMDPRTLVMSIACQGGSSRGKRCGMVYSIHAIAAIVGTKRRIVRGTRKSGFVQVQNDYAKEERGR